LIWKHLAPAVRMVTFRPGPYPSGPFPTCNSESRLSVGDRMSSGGSTNKRSGDRTKAVIPVRVKGKDSAGKAFEELVITLDVNPDGIRLGSVHHELNLLEEITVFYRQRKIQFRVIWTKKMKGTSEFHVGLQAVAQDFEAWGLNFAGYKRQPAAQSTASPASVGA
jgi:hypothetical protein